MTDRHLGVIPAGLMLCVLMLLASVHDVAAQTACVNPYTGALRKVSGEGCSRREGELPLVWTPRPVPAQVTDPAAAAEIFSLVLPTSGDFTVTIFSRTIEGPLPTVPRGAKLKISGGADYTPARYLAQEGKKDEFDLLWMEWAVTAGIAAVSDPSFEATLIRGLEAEGYAPVSEGADFTILYDELDTYFAWSAAHFTRTPLLGQVLAPLSTREGYSYKKNVRLSLFPGNLGASYVRIPAKLEDIYPSCVWEGTVRGDLSSFRGNAGLFLKPILSRLGKKIKSEKVKVKQPKK